MIMYIYQSKIGDYSDAYVVGKSIYLDEIIMDGTTFVRSEFLRHSTQFNRKRISFFSGRELDVRVHTIMGQLCD